MENLGGETHDSTSVSKSRRSNTRWSLAVIRFKKHFGFYKDLGGEHYAAYAINGNAITNEDEA